MPNLISFFLTSKITDKPIQVRNFAEIRNFAKHQSCSSHNQLNIRIVDVLTNTGVSANFKDKELAH